MKLDVQTIADVFANRLGSINQRVMSAVGGGPTADFKLDGAFLQVKMDKHLSVSFVVTDIDNDALSPSELAFKYVDPALESMRQSFSSTLKQIVVSAPLPARTEQEAVAKHNNLHVRVGRDVICGGIRYSLEVWLGTFSI